MRSGNSPKMPQASEMDVEMFRRSNRAAQLEAWLETRADALVWLLVLVGLYLRVHRAGLSYLNGDETQIMFPPLQRGFANVYTAGLVFPYGPVLPFFLHAVSYFGTSELYLRM